MDSKHRFFLIFEGSNNSYPNYSNAKLHITESDPASLDLKHLYVCSPIFPILGNGITSLPDLGTGAKITFVMVPKIYPTCNELINHFGITNQLWFSLGLANLVIIEEQSGTLGSDIVKYLEAESNVTAYEEWLFNEELELESKQNYKLYQTSTKYEELDIILSADLDTHLQFAISEYIISVKKFLIASYKFTPHYYSKHLATIKQSLDFIYDLSFLGGDYSFTPTSSLLSSLQASDKDAAIAYLSDPANSTRREEMLNDRHGMVVTFNSSMSYIYSQAYSGTFPILEHHGIIRRHSLLGVGTAISALFELIIQVEQALFCAPFEDLNNTDYNTAPCSNKEWYQVFQEPSLFEKELWERDEVRQTVIDKQPEACNVEFPDDFYHRLSFFSGRLGFKEYEFSATAAIQVLVESHKLNWHVINYTHEIIHNHVRIILNFIFNPPKSLRDEEHDNWIEHYRNVLKDIVQSPDTFDYTKLTYKDYFSLILVKFVINSPVYGSISRPADIDRINLYRSDTDADIMFPHTHSVKEFSLYLYRDITEIFVHIIDFTYVYNRSIETYLVSIWLSWSTIPAVTYDLKHYISRTLVVIGIYEDGNLKERFQKSLARFRQIIEMVKERKLNDALWSRIDAILSNEAENTDLQFRFYNCIIVGDLVQNFFIGRLEAILDNDDVNRLPKDSKDDHGNKISYYVETNSFEGQPIMSKVRFVQDQLEREIFKASEHLTSAEVERTSAWLLLSLSSNNND